jgi:hypothetical protein
MMRLGFGLESPSKDSLTESPKRALTGTSPTSRSDGDFSYRVLPPEGPNEVESNFQDVADADSAIVSIIEGFESVVEVNDLVLSEVIGRFVHAIFLRKRSTVVMLQSKSSVSFCETSSDIYG